MEVKPALQDLEIDRLGWDGAAEWLESVAGTWGCAADCQHLGREQERLAVARHWRRAFFSPYAHGTVYVLDARVPYAC